jgi:hypothetical protein
MTFICPFFSYIGGFGCISVVEKYRNWLMPPDPSTNHHIAAQKHLHDTGLWLLEHKTYMAWKEKPNSFMWIHGIGGQRSN